MWLQKACGRQTKANSSPLRRKEVECPFTYMQFSGCGHVLSPAHRERRPVVLTQPAHTREEGKREGRGEE